jgi:hypothetical protein
VQKGLDEDGKVELPFQFVFPSSVELKAKPCFPERKGFEHEPGHALPPKAFISFRYSEGVLEH